jgi:hypothetical protein
LRQHRGHKNGEANVSENAILSLIDEQADAGTLLPFQYGGKAVRR